MGCKTPSQLERVKASDCERGSNPVRAPRRPRRAPLTPSEAERSADRRRHWDTGLVYIYEVSHSVYTYLYL